MYTVTRLVRTCTACPSQWDGDTDQGNSVYIRYRWGRLSVDIDDKEVLYFYTDEPYGGFMSTEDMMDLTKNILTFTCEEWEN